MTPPSVGGEHLDAVREELDLSFSDLWFRYVAVGGRRWLPALTSHLSHGQTWPVGDHVHAVTALNDYGWRPYAVGAG
jgi:hypothetical protein